MDTSNDTSTKRCSKCHIDKPYTVIYFRQRKSRNGNTYLLGKCRSCEADEAKEFRQNNPEAFREIKRRSNCKHSEKRRIAKRRWDAANREHVQAYAELHREETRERGRKWREDNPERSLAYVHMRRARLQNNGGSYTAADIDLQRKAQTNKGGVLMCWLCGKPIKGRFHIDHFIPIVRGGSNSPENIRLTHPTCNLQKASKTPQEYNGQLL